MNLSDTELNSAINAALNKLIQDKVNEQVAEVKADCKRANESLVKQAEGLKRELKKYHEEWSLGGLQKTIHDSLERVGFDHGGLDWTQKLNAIADEWLKWKNEAGRPAKERELLEAELMEIKRIFEDSGVVPISVGELMVESVGVSLLPRKARQVVQQLRDAQATVKELQLRLSAIKDCIEKPR